MSLIATVDPESATGEVAAIYAQVKEQIGMIPNGLKAFSASPHRLKTQVGEIGYYMAHPSLSAPLTAAIRYTVAKEHDCTYCVGMNGGMLRRAGWTAEAVVALPTDPTATPFEPKDRAMFQAVVKAVRTPGALAAADIEGLRTLGWSDQDILDGVAHGAYSMAFDMILNALKIVPEGG